MSSMSITWYISAVILFLGVLPSNCQDHKDLNGTGSGDPAPHGDSNQTRTTGNKTGYLTVQHFEELSRELKDLSQSAQELQNMTQQTLDWRRVLMVIEEILLNMLLFFWGFYVGVRYYRAKCEKDNGAVLTMRVPNFDSGATLVMNMRPPEGESRPIHIHRTGASFTEVTVVPDPPSMTTAVPINVPAPVPTNTMTSMWMSRFTSTALLLLALWTLPSSGEVIQATDRMFLMMVKCLSVIGLGLLGLNFYTTVMEREVEPPQNTSYITHQYAYNTSNGVQNLNTGSGSSNAVGNVADRNSCSSDQSMPGTAEVPTNRNESADPAGLTIAVPNSVPVGVPDGVPDGVPVGVPVNVQVDEPVPASTTDNTARLVTMKTNSQNDDRNDTLVPLSLETPH